MQLATVEIGLVTVIFMKRRLLAVLGFLCLCTTLAIGGCKGTRPASSDALAEKTPTVSEGSGVGSGDDRIGKDTGAGSDKGSTADTQGKKPQTASPDEQADGDTYTVAGCTVTLPAAWRGRGSVTTDEPGPSVHPADYPQEELCSVYTSPTDQVTGGDIGYTLVSQTDLGDGNSLCVMAGNYSYIVPDARHSQWVEHPFSDAEAAALVDLTTGGSVTVEELDRVFESYMEDPGEADPLLFASADYIAANVKIGKP